MKYLAANILLMIGLVVMFIGAPFVIIGELIRKAANAIVKLANEITNSGVEGGK